MIVMFSAIVYRLKDDIEALGPGVEPATSCNKDIIYSSSSGDYSSQETRRKCRIIISVIDTYIMTGHSRHFSSMFD